MRKDTVSIDISLAEIESVRHLVYLRNEADRAEMYERMVNAWLKSAVAAEVPELDGEVWLGRKPSADRWSATADQMYINIWYSPGLRAKTKLRYEARQFGEGNLVTQTVVLKTDNRFDQGEEILKARVVPFLEKLFREVFGWTTRRADF